MRHSAHQAFCAIKNVLYRATVSESAAERRCQILRVLSVQEGVILADMRCAVRYLSR
jgi:hypothetical protein